MKFRLVTAQSSSVNADGYWGVQSDAFGKDAAVGHFPMMHPFGFISRPVDPDSASGVGCLVLEGVEGGSEGFSWLCHDPRYQAKIPPLSQGSSCQYNCDGAFVYLDAQGHALTGYVPVEGGTQAHSFQIGYDTGGKLVLNFVHANGMAILMSDQTITIKNAAGDAYWELNAEGTVLNGNTKLVGGLDVGGEGAQPMINLTLFETWWAAMVAVVTAVPVYGAAIGGAMAGATATLPGTGTTLAKAL